MKNLKCGGKSLPDITCRFEFCGRIYEADFCPLELHKWAGKVWTLIRGICVEVEIVNGDDSSITVAHPYRITHED